MELYWLLMTIMVYNYWLLITHKSPMANLPIIANGYFPPNYLMVILSFIAQCLENK